MLAIQGSQTVFKIPLLSSLVLLFSIHWVWLAPNVHNNRKVVDLLREFVIVGRTVHAVECVQLCCFFYSDEGSDTWLPKHQYFCTMKILWSEFWDTFYSKF